MTNLNNKLKDWLELKNIVETIKLSRGEVQSHALEMYFDRFTKYVHKHDEDFNPLRKPYDIR